MTRPARCLRVAALVAVLLLVSPARAAEGDGGPDARPAAAATFQLRAALDAYDRAMSGALEADEAAAELRRAADAFEALLAAGYDSAGLQYNLGNTYYRLGDYGRAVLAYRRGLRAAPADPRLAHHLALARRHVEPQWPPTGERRLLHQLFFWHFSTALPTRLAWAMGLSVAGWTLLALRWRWRRTALAVGGVLLIVHGLGAGVSVAWQVHDERQRPPAVIVTGAPELRLGRGAAFAAALDTPLGAGTELRIVQERAGWLEVELPNGQRGWLADEGVARVLR